MSEFAAEPTLHSWRAGAAFAHAHTSRGGMLISLGAGSRMRSLLGEDFRVKSVRHIHSAADSVLSRFGSRTLFENLKYSVQAPNFDDESAAALHVQSGLHMEGLVYRLMALALEHALVPFTSHVQVLNARESYWYMIKYRHDDGIVHSLQDVASLDRFASPHSLGDDSCTMFVVYVGHAKLIRGMALLSRIGACDGPLHGQRAFLLGREGEATVLMAGRGNLMNGLPKVEAPNLWEAIEEACAILRLYNHVDETAFERMLEIAAQNLCVMNQSLVQERGTTSLGVRGRFEQASITDMNRLQLLCDRAEANLGQEVFTQLGAFTQETRLQAAADVFSLHDREFLYAPAVPDDGFAPATYDVVNAQCAACLADVGFTYPLPLDNEQFLVAHLDIDYLRAGTALPQPLYIRDLNVGNVMSCFSGRSVFRLYVQIPCNPNMVAPEGFERNENPPNDVVFATNADHPDAPWFIWNGAVDSKAQPAFPLTGVAYVVASRMPAFEMSYPSQFIPPASTLRHFTFPGEQRISFYDVELYGRTRRYLNEKGAMDTWVRWLTDDWKLLIPLINCHQQRAFLIGAFSHFWEAANLANTQNDAFRRWCQAAHRQDTLTRLPDQCFSWLGGVHVQKDVRSDGGLWTLAFTRMPKYINFSDGHVMILKRMQNPDSLARYLFELRK